MIRFHDLLNQKLSEDRLKSFQLTNPFKTLLKFYLLKRANKDLLNDLLYSQIDSCITHFHLKEKHLSEPPF